MNAFMLLLTGILIPILVSEAVDWLPWVATRAIRLAARRLPVAYQARYTEEWQAELDALPGGKLTKLVFALRIYADAPKTGAALRGMTSPSGLAFKSVFDKMAAAAGLLLLAPLLAVIAILIMCCDGGPVLFRQTRVGKDGQTFTVYKFRTLIDSQGGLRATRTGSWLRRYSLDEVPQLLNVILGDMSLVGPRPPLPEEAARYSDYVRRRLAVKPGLTGLWQVSGRSDMSWEDSVRIDLRYVENWSLVLDLQILWRTWSAVMRTADQQQAAP